MVDLGHRRRPACAARPRAEPIPPATVACAPSAGAGLRERLGSRPQAGEIDPLRAVGRRLRRLLLDLADVLDDLPAVGSRSRTAAPRRRRAAAARRR